MIHPPRSPLQRRIRGIWISILRMLVHIMHRRNTPEAIAGGVALGLFIAFTPTVGLQIITAVALATPLRANRAAAVLAVCVTNVVTIPPLFAFTYWVGNFFWDGPSVGAVYGKLHNLASELYRMQFYEVFAQFRELLRMGVDVFVPMTIGGVIVGGLAAGLSYPASKSLVRKYRRFRRRRRKEKRRLLREKRQAREARASQAQAERTET